MGSLPDDGIQNVLVRSLPADLGDRSVATDEKRQAALVALPLRERLRRVGVLAALEVADERDARLLLPAVVHGPELQVGVALHVPERDLLARVLDLDRDVVRVDVFWFSSRLM